MGLALHGCFWAATWLRRILGGVGSCAVERDLNVNRLLCQDLSGRKTL